MICQSRGDLVSNGPLMPLPGANMLAQIVLYDQGLPQGECLCWCLPVSFWKAHRPRNGDTVPPNRNTGSGEALSGRDSFGSPSDGFPGGVHYDDDAPEGRKVGFRWPTEETRHETRRHSCERAMAFLVRSFRTSTTPTKPEPQQGRYERRGRQRAADRRAAICGVLLVKHDGRRRSQTYPVKQPWNEPGRRDEPRRPGTGCS
ncbi:hypothetical protein LZ31DRAFT_323052 [Colletotrichum somersetense]|nr:hypothetical protein LZ31DRAFT_323052 [Colletotrichum somersetense]